MPDHVGQHCVCLDKGQTAVAHHGNQNAQRAGNEYPPFRSQLARSQIVAVFVSAFLVVAMVMMWLLGRVADAPLDGIFANLALHNLHFSPCKAGKVHLRDIVYYLSVTGFFLFSATRMLEARRWR